MDDVISVLKHFGVHVVFVAEFFGVKLLMFSCFGSAVLLCPNSFKGI